MLLAKKRWTFSERNPNVERTLTEALGLSPLFARLLANRDISTPEEADRFLRPKLSHLHDPFLLPQMKKATHRIWHAVSKGERITVYGDYDVDGITATALMMLVLEGIGAQADYYLPNRFEEGYGLNKKALKALAEKGTRVVVTVDCGITAVDQVKLARELGMDVIVTDHHRCGPDLPPAHALVCPSLPESEYPFQELAGVGVAYKLAQGLLLDKHGQQKADELAHKHLDLVALGSIADVVPLLDENRTLCSFGLKALMKSSKLGIQALLQASGIARTQLNSGHVGFVLGPRINATGRLSQPDKALDLLLSKNTKEAENLAQELQRLNQLRQDMQREIFDQAIGMMSPESDQEKAIVLSHPSWHPGIIGIVASRISDMYHRPTILLAQQKDVYRGTARSVPSFDILKALRRCERHLLRLGGHEAAAGFELPGSRLEEFKTSFLQVANELLLPGQLSPQLMVDAEIDLSELSLELVAELNQFEPFGMGNPRPLLSAKGLHLKGRPQIVGTRHLKFWVNQDGHTLEVIGFHMADRSLERRRSKDELEILFSPNVNTWRGKTSVQLNLKDFRWKSPVSASQELVREEPLF